MSKTKKNLEEIFADMSCYDSDVWVADYTEPSKRKGWKMTAEERKVLPTGVHIRTTAFTDVAAFHLENEKHIDFWGVNFENHKSFFPSGKRDCECMFRVMDVEKGWILLCELKYSLDKEKNNLKAAENAYEQLKNTWEVLKARVRLDRHCKVYFNLSFPEHQEDFPFSDFVFDQEDRLKWKEKHHVTIFGANDMLIVTNGSLMVPKVAV